VAGLSGGKQPGHHKDGTADARRSTGVHWKKHNAIMKIMPNLPPGWREFPSLLCEIKIWRMGNAPGGV